MRVTIIGPNLRDQSKGQLHVHAEGCADIRRMARREPEYQHGWTIEAKAQRDVVEATYDPGDFEWDPKEDYGMYRSEFHFFPCCSSLTVE